MHDPVMQVQFTDMETKGSFYMQMEKFICQESEFYFLNAQYF